MNIKCQLSWHKTGYQLGVSIGCFSFVQLRNNNMEDVRELKNSENVQINYQVEKIKPNFVDLNLDDNFNPIDTL